MFLVKKMTSLVSFMINLTDTRFITHFQILTFHFSQPTSECATILRFKLIQKISLSMIVWKIVEF